MFLSKLFDKRGHSQGSKNAGKADVVPERSSDTRWRAVEIRPGLFCCKTAAKIANRIYLASEAPTFPLDGCSEKKCQCKYKFLDDRRNGEDRRDDFVTLSSVTQSFENDRRHLRGRRTSDFDD